jgi:hypothetical protein
MQRTRWYKTRNVQGMFAVGLTAPGFFILPQPAKSVRMSCVQPKIAYLFLKGETGSLIFPDLQAESCKNRDVRASVADIVSIKSCGTDIDAPWFALTRRVDIPMYGRDKTRPIQPRGGRSVR